MDISTVADLVSQLRKKVDMQNKESVELTSVYLLEGCGKTHAKINDTIPPHSDRYGVSGHAEYARPQVSIRK